MDEVHEYELEFKSTMEERYDSDLLATVEAYLQVRGVRVTGSYGGSFVAEPDNPNSSDNGFCVETDEATAATLAGGLQELLGRPVSVERCSEPERPAEEPDRNRGVTPGWKALRHKVTRRIQIALPPRNTGA